MKFKDKPVIETEEDRRHKEELAEQIIADADKPSSSKKTLLQRAEKDPWERISGIREVSIFSFRVPKRDMQKLKYISKETNMSINTICLSAVRDFAKKQINELKKEV